MFCGNCGSEIPDEAKYCPKCGSHVAGAGTYQSGGGSGAGTYQGQGGSGAGTYPGGDSSGGRGNAKPANKNRTIGVIVLVTAVILIVLIARLLLGGRGYERTAEEYVEAMFEADAESMMELMPGDLTDALEEEIASSEWLGGTDAVYRYLNMELADSLSSIDDQLGSGWDYSCEIIDTEDWSQGELSEWIDDILYDYGVNIEAREGKTVTVLVTMESSDGLMTEEEEVPVPVVKIGRTWYVGAD